MASHMTLFSWHKKIKGTRPLAAPPLLRMLPALLFLNMTNIPLPQGHPLLPLLNICLLKCQQLMSPHSVYISCYLLEEAFKTSLDETLQYLFYNVLYH